MFWCVPNEMEQRKELIGFYVFMRIETILSNFTRIDSFTASLVLQIVMWCNRNAKEPLAPEKNYFLVITPAPQSLVTVSYLDEQNVHVFTCTPYSPDYGLCNFFFSICFLQVRKQKLVGRRFLMDTWSVNICHFRAHDFSTHHSTSVRRSWKSWNCIAKRE